MSKDKDKISLPCKKGAISTQEKKFIKENTGVLTVEEIAEKLNRNVDFVKKYTVKSMASAGVYNPEDIDYEIKLKIESSESWKAVVKELTESEMRRFIEIYTKMIGQFRGDVTAIEETQIMQAAKMEILMSREMQLMRNMTEQIEKLETELMGFGKNEDLEVDEMARKNLVEEMLSSYRTGMSQSHTPHLKMQEKFNELIKMLKGSRDQRINKIDSIKVSWIDVLKEINDDTTREIAGITMETNQREYKKEFKRLASSHTYTNQTVDQPILSSESYHEEDGNNLEKDTGSETTDKEDS